MNITRIMILFVTFSTMELPCAVSGESQGTDKPSTTAAQRKLPPDYFSRHWRLLSSDALDEIVGGRAMTDAEVSSIIELLKKSSPSKLKQLERNVAKSKQDRPGSDQSLQLADLQQRVVRERSLIIERTMQVLLHSDLRLPDNRKYLNLYKEIALTVSPSEIPALTPPIPVLLGRHNDDDAFLAATSGIDVLNRNRLLSQPEKLPFGPEIIAGLEQFMKKDSEATRTPGPSGSTRGVLARELLIETGGKQAGSIAEQSLKDAAAASSLTDLFNKMPPALAAYSHTLDPDLLPYVFSIGDVISQHQDTKLRQTYFWHLVSIAKDLENAGQISQKDKIISYLTRGAIHGVDLEWSQMCSGSLHKL
jgi:hypothetical protein